MSSTAPDAPRAATGGRELPVPASGGPGDIEGAFGTIRVDSDSRSLRSRLLALLAIIGPGLIVMVGDNDAGGVST